MQYLRKSRQAVGGGVWAHQQRRTWFWRYSVNGKRRCVRIGTFDEFPTKAKAEDYARRHILSRILDRLPAHPTIEEFKEQHKELRKLYIAVGTLRLENLRLRQEVAVARILLTARNRSPNPDAGRRDDSS